MVDGGVSIAVRSVYPGKQARILPSEVLQQVKNTAGKVVRRAESFFGHEYQSDCSDRNDSNCRRSRPARAFLTLPSGSYTCERSFKRCSVRQRSFAR